MDLIGTILISVGVLAFVVAAVGLIKLPDLYSRISAVTTASGLGLSLIISGVFLHQPTLGNGLKSGLAIVINLSTAAVGGHAIARAGYLTGAPRARIQYDDLTADSED